MLVFDDDKVTDCETTTTRASTVIGKGVKFQRIRRITGYLVGTTDRFNNAKQHEEKDRVKHGMPECCGNDK